MGLENIEAVLNVCFCFGRYLLRTNLKIFSLEFFKGLHGLDSNM